MPRSARSRHETAEKEHEQKGKYHVEEIRRGAVGDRIVAGPALAQTSGTATPAAPQAQSQPSAVSAPVKTTKTATSVRHAKKHTAKIKSGTMHQARHAKPAKSHQASFGKTKTATKTANKSATAVAKHS